MDSYLQGVIIGERSIIVFCRENNYDFTALVDSGFRNLMSNYLALNNLTDFCMIFLCEGQISLIRYMYAILKVHKDFIKSSKGGLL